MSAFKPTPSQQSVIDHRGSALLVSAAAGSGKTKVLVERLLSRICDPISPCNVDDFLVITFTNAAAGELRSRIASEISSRLAVDPGNRHLRDQLSRVYLADISTVHGFCTRLLRQYSYLLDIPAEFRVGEESECATLRKKSANTVMERFFSGELTCSHVQPLLQTLGYGRDDRRLQELIQQTDQNVQCHPYPGHWMENCRREIMLENAVSVGDTVWGKYILEDLRLFLQEGETILASARDVIRDSVGLEKLEEVVQADEQILSALSQDMSWDNIHRLSAPDFMRLPTIRNPEDPDAKVRFTKLRDDFKAALRAKLSPFVQDPDMVMKELREISKPLLGLLELVEVFGDVYRSFKHQRRVLDFSDLEHEAISLLTDAHTLAPSAVALEVAQRYQEIMVDEYQDSNAVQETIFRAISQKSSNLFMVGDVKQSIYRFRLADPGIFLSKYRSYTAQDVPDGTPRKINLSHNFRSNPHILHAANHVFSCVMSQKVGDMDYGEEEALHPGREEYPSLGEPAVELHLLQSVGTDDEDSPDRVITEADYVAGQIRRLLDEEHYISDGGNLRRICENDIAVLMRSLSSTAEAYVKALSTLGIRSSCERSEDVLCAPEVTCVLSWMHIVDNPQQDIPLVAAMSSPLGGFTADELASIRGGRKGISFLDAVTEAVCHDAKCTAFLEKLSNLRKARLYLTLPEFFDHLCGELKAQDVFGAMEDGADRVRNILTLRGYLLSCVNAGMDTLGHFLRHIEDLRTQQLRITNPSEPGDGVKIMTIHKSKGLEFPVVFLCDLARQFNTQDTKNSVLLDPELMIGSNFVDKERMYQYPSVAKRAVMLKKKKDMLSEEMRVLYVAMTRPRDRLIMTYCSSKTDLAIARASFLSDGKRLKSASSDVNCIGQWVLNAAAMLPEGSRVFSGKAPVQPSGEPWKICYSDAVMGDRAAGDLNAERPVSSGNWDVSCLERKYGYETAANLPAKLTATQLKGRSVDAESAEAAAQEWKTKRWSVRPRPFLSSRDQLTPAEKGTAVHLFMQFCDYERCRTIDGIKEEKRRMVEQQFMSQQQVQAVDTEKIAEFFVSDVGKIIFSGELKREFKFSLLVDSEDYFPEAPGEKIMLQGVVDCFVIHNDEITVLDFKTDRLQPGEEYIYSREYMPQLLSYSKALERIYGLPVTRRILYFFSTGSYYEI